MPLTFKTFPSFEETNAIVIVSNPNSNATKDGMEKTMEKVSARGNKNIQILRISER